MHYGRDRARACATCSRRDREAATAGGTGAAHRSGAAAAERRSPRSIRRTPWRFGTSRPILGAGSGGRKTMWGRRARKSGLALPSGSGWARTGRRPGRVQFARLLWLSVVTPLLVATIGVSLVRPAERPHSRPIVRITQDT